MKRGFEHALDECLSQLNTGEFSLDEVLAHYPEHEAELRPLLQMAMRIGQVPKAVPSPAARAAGRQQLLAAVAKKRREQAQARPGLLRRLEQSASILMQPLMRPQRQPLRLAQAIAALLLIVSLISAGTVRVAAGSLPDSLLYPIKLTTERVQLALTTTPAGKARLHMSYSERRLEEAKAMLEAGKGMSEATLEAMENERNAALMAIGRTPEAEWSSLLADFTFRTEKQQTTLEEMKPEVAPPDQETVDKALEATGEDQWVATEAMKNPDLLKPEATASPAPSAAGPHAAPQPTPTQVPPTFTPTQVPPTFTPTQVPPTFTPTHIPTDTPVPTATPVPPTATPVPTATPKPTATSTPQAVVPPFEPEELTPTETPQGGIPPFQPATAEPMTPPPTLTPTVTPMPTATHTPTATPMPTSTPTPVPTVAPTATPTPQAEVPFQPVTASVVTNCRVSNAPKGDGVSEFPVGTGKVYIVFDYAYMAGEEVRTKVYNSNGKVLLEEVRTLSGDGTESIPCSAGGEGFAAGRYLVDIYKGGGLITTIIWDVTE